MVGSFELGDNLCVRTNTPCMQAAVQYARPDSPLIMPRHKRRTREAAAVDQADTTSSSSSVLNELCRRYNLRLSTTSEHSRVYDSDTVWQSQSTGSIYSTQMQCKERHAQAKALADTMAMITLVPVCKLLGTGTQVY